MASTVGLFYNFFVFFPFSTNINILHVVLSFKLFLVPINFQIIAGQQSISPDEGSVEKRGMHVCDDFAITLGIVNS